MALESIYGTCMSLLYLVSTMNENAITVNLLSHQLRSLCSHSKYDILLSNTWKHCKRKYRYKAVMNMVRFRDISKYPFIIVSLVWHVSFFCISLNDYIVHVSNKHLVPFSARPWQWFLMVIVVVFDVHAVQHFKLWDYHISTY